MGNKFWAKLSILSPFEFHRKLGKNLVSFSYVLATVDHMPKSALLNNSKTCTVSLWPVNCKFRHYVSIATSISACNSKKKNIWKWNSVEFVAVPFCKLSPYLGRPERSVPDGLLFYHRCFFLVSPVVLRAPSTDRPETLPHDQNLAEFYNPTPKKFGGCSLPPKKKLGAKNMQKFGQLWTTFDFDREYLRNTATYPKSERRTN